MSGLKFTAIIILSLTILGGCSILTKVKEKLTSSKEKVPEKEKTKDVSSDNDLNFYNKYIEVMNKVQESGENVYRYYITDIPAPESITKNSFILPVSLQIYSGTLGSTVKNYKRSLLDGGELSKLKASPEMQTTLETDLKELLPLMEEFSVVSEKVSKYYSNKDYKDDLSKVKPYDEEMKNAYDKYKTAFNKFSSDLKKFKPERKIYDPSEASDPDEASSQIMLNAYGDILDAAENFYESFENLKYNSDMTDAKTKFYEFEMKFGESKNIILKTEFSEKVKFMKYNFEDYFTSSVEKFLDTGKNFFEKARDSKNEKTFNKNYNDMVNAYNLMITSYNTNVGNINMTRTW